MNTQHLLNILNTFKLYTDASSVRRPIQVYGGLLHTMWRINTDKGSFAIKALSQNINLKDKSIQKNYELTENIATNFANNGIPAICALKIPGSNNHLKEIEGQYYLVYPWIENQSLSENEPTMRENSSITGTLKASHSDTNTNTYEENALKIACLVAKIHHINLQVPGLVAPQLDFKSNEEIKALINLIESKKFDNPTISTLKELQDFICTLNDEYEKAIPILKSQSVVSHADLDPKNVLWNKENEPFIIDWESARKVNPTYDILNVALDWSGIITEHFNEALFLKMLKIYQDEGGKVNSDHLQPAFYGVFGNWLNWLFYNISLACISQSAEEIEKSIVQIAQTLATLIRLRLVMNN